AGTLAGSQARRGARRGRRGRRARALRGRAYGGSGGARLPVVDRIEPRIVLTVDRVAKRYATPRGDLTILTDVSLSLEAGAEIPIMGPSGSGKSTLLYVLGALEPPSSGTVMLDGQDPYRLDEPAQARVRNERIGFVFQDPSLLPQCSVLENVLAPTLVAAAPRRDATRDLDRARTLLS